MSREIKFRAWDVKNKRFVDDVLLACNKHSFLYQNYDRCEFIAEDRDIILSQFTGLKDRNGVEIYENDVLKFNWDHFGIVEFFQSSFMLRNCSTKEYEGQYLFNVVSYYAEQIERIGNSFENPELIKG